MSFRWGIIATGGISTKFALDLMTDPSLRGSDVQHAITAVGSRSAESAQRFIDGLKSTSDAGAQWGVTHSVVDGAKAGVHADVYSSPDVDCVYVGTPPGSHYQNCRDALLAGKHVLCEKPFTVDVDELDELVALANEKKLFLMEAVWTRFHPLAGAVRDVIASKKLGKPLRYGGNFSMDWKPDEQPVTKVMLDPAGGGGSLFDMGPYASVWAMLLVHNSPYNTDPDPRVLTSFQTLYERTGVDANSRWVVQWKDLCQGDMMTDLLAPGLREATAWVQCEHGDLVIEYPPYRPETFHIVPRPDRYIGSITTKETFHHPIEGCFGLVFEADHVAREVRKGSIESPLMTHAESRVVQGWFDTVRKAGPTKTANLPSSAKKAQAKAA